jgi:hypothetical protein
MAIFSTFLILANNPVLRSEEDPYMFGTLVICLPSLHEGGEIYASHGGKEKLFKTAEPSEYWYSCLYWFVIHLIGV